MKLNYKIFFNFCILFLGVIPFCSAQEINYVQTSLTNLKMGSKATKKPYFIYLFDQNCDDCLRVEQMTLSDGAVSNVINDHLLATKIDINSLEGQKLKQKKKIKLAPAFLFYNMKGKLLLQQETAMSSHAMLKLLNVLYDLDVDPSSTKNSEEQFDNIKHIKVIAPRELSSVDDLNINSLKVISDHKVSLKNPRRSLRIKAAKIPLLSNAIINKAKKNNLKSPIQLFDPNYVEKPEAHKLISAENKLKIATKPDLTNAVPISSKPPNAKLVNTEVTHKTVLYTADRTVNTVDRNLKNKPTSTVNKRSKTIQFAAFTKYDDVLKGMYKMKRKIKSPLTIIEEYTNGKLMYKLVSADQMTTSEANIQIKSFQQRGIDCFVRKSL